MRQVEAWVERGEYDPEDIVLTSFTRSAAAVLKGRIEVPRDNVATLHSLARRIVGQELPIAEVGTLAKQWNESGIPPAWRIGSDVGLIDDDGLAPMAEATSALSEWSLARSKMLPHGHPTWEHLRPFGTAWDDFKRETDSIDFTDMIELAFMSGDPLPGHKPVLMVDEAQDLVPLQWQLVRHWAQYDTLKDFIVLGDPAQCQPPGTMVETRHGAIPIEDLDPTIHEVASYERKSSYLVKGRKFKKASRRYIGDLWKVTTDGRSTRGTSTHRWWARWNDRARESAHVVYLMCRDDKWRVGWCKLFSGRDTFHFGVRARLEKADQAWVLGVYDDRTEASIMESYVSTRYGIPTVNWEAVDGQGLYSKEAIEHLYGMLDLDAMCERAWEALKDFHRAPLAPMYDREERYRRKGKRTSMVIESANLLPGYMEIPRRTDTGIAWGGIEVDRERFDGEVYSLDVDRDKLYFADGILTHNSIYSFAGARPEEMLSEMPEDRVRRLGQSHRMPRAIHEYAERYLSSHGGSMMTGREYLPRDEEGSVRRLPATWRVPDLVVSEAERAADEGQSTLILATCSYMLEPTINLLRARGRPFANPYRRSNGRWNPLGARRQGSSRTVDRLAAYSEGRDPQLWLPMLRAEVYATRGAKKYLEEEPVTWREWMRPEHRDAVEAGDVDWLMGHAMKDVAKPLEYASRIIKRHGAQAVEGEPLIMIGTGHSIKGGEADNAILFPDLSQAGGREVMEGRGGRDASIRLGYVMATRAKNGLIICAPGGRDALEL